MHHRHAEHRHHRVPDELLHRPPVALDHRPRRIEIPGHHLPETPRIQPLPQRRRPAHITKQHRDRLALLARRRHSHQRRAAAVAEPGIRRILTPTPSTHPHTSKAKPQPPGPGSRRTLTYLPPPMVLT